MPLPDHLILSTDFDGTLTSPSRPDLLCPEFMDWITEARRKSKITWIINTGRCWPSLSAELERRQARIWPDWVVLVEREIHRVRDKLLRPHQPWNNRCASLHARLFAESASLWVRMRGDFHRYENLQLVEDIGCPLGLIAHSESQADAIEEDVLERIAANRDLIMVRNSIYFRFGHAAFTKGSCLREIARQEGLDAASCYAAGDHYNDLTMLARTSARFICCPSNSAERVKLQVRSENGRVSELAYSDGVVDGLKHFFG